jgi:LacI family transcriptional regulator
VTGPRRFTVAVLRAQGAQAALAAVGLELAGGEPFYGEWTEEWGRQATTALLRSVPGLDAIFCGNDQIARGAADAARDAGRAIPDEVALVGFDNWEVVAAACRPPLTTVDMNLRQLGRTAGERLLAAIEGHPSAGVELLPCNLVIRESTRPRAATAPGGSGAAELAGPAGAAVSPGAVPVAATIDSPAGPLGASG